MNGRESDVEMYQFVQQYDTQQQDLHDINSMCKEN